MLRIWQISLDDNNLINYNHKGEINMNTDSLNTTYSAIIVYRNGGNRGYTIQAGSQKDAFTKLMNHVNFDLVSRVEIAEIVMDEDMIK